VIEIRARFSCVEEVAFTASTDWERAIEALTYQAIAPLVSKIDRKLRRLNAEVLGQLERSGRHKIRVDPPMSMSGRSDRPTRQ
jgi:hypothetical protein